MSKQEEKVRFSIGDMFEQAFTNHSEEEMEQYWGAGAPGNIPSIENLPEEGPRPWMFVRILGLSVAVFLILLYSWYKFHNTNFLPGLIFIGSAAMPISVMILFFELNARRNVSMYLTTKMLFLGGVLSLLLTMVNNIVVDLLGFNMDWMGAMSAGPVEETAKLLAVICILANRRRYPYILNGLLFGAAVGAGFGLFETAGYAMRALIKQVILICVDNGEALKAILIQSQKEAGALGLEVQLEKLFKAAAGAGDKQMMLVLGIRAILAPAGHVIWTALNAAALWRVKGGENFRIGHLFDIRFFSIFICTVCFHMAWNSDWDPELVTSYDKYIILGLLGWSLVFWMIRKGLQEVRNARETHDKQVGETAADGEQVITQVIQDQADYVRNLVSVRITKEEARVNVVREGSTGNGVQGEQPQPLPQPAKTSKPNWRDYYNQQ